MKKIIYFISLFSYVLFAMDQVMQQKLRDYGIDPVRIKIDLAKIGLITYQHVGFEEIGTRSSYWAAYENGSIGGTFWNRGGEQDIECTLCVRILKNDRESVIETSINSIHYHLLRILYVEQQKKLQKRGYYQLQLK